MTVVSNSAGTTEMPALLSIPPKETDSIQWRGALLKYIDAAYAEDTQKYEQDAAILDKLRNSTVVGQNTASLALLDQLFSYYSQVTFIGTRFPLDVGLKFSWRNTFDSSGKKVSLYNLHFERACTVFCIGSLYSRLGCEESRISTDGIRKSCNYFQNAAGCFKYIERELLNDLRATPPIDMQPKSLRSLQSLMLAQAQECIWQKAVMEHMKHGTIARLAIKVADFYNDVVPDNSSFLPSEWQSYIKIKACYFNAVAQYQKANECISQGRYGEEIGRLRVADSYNRKALDSIASSTRTILRRGGGGGFSMQESFIKDVKLLQEAIERDLIRAEKDNDVIYLETVPEPSQLAPILRSDMVKPIVPADIVDPAHWKKTSDEELNRPLFERLVPFAVHQAASVYADRKEFIVKMEIQAHCEQMSEEYSKLCSQLDLPRALDLVDPDALPATLIACVEEVQHEGGGQALRDMLNNVHQLSVKNVQLVDEGFNALEEENDQDDIFRRQYGNLWSRPPSQQLTSTLLTQGTKYHDTLLAAQKADRIVRAKVGNWGKAIDLLSRPVREIISCLPSIRDDESVQLEQLEELMSRLRKLLQESEEIAVRRKRILDEAQSLADADDIYEALMAKSAQLTNGATTVKIEPEQFTEVFDKELKKYEGLQSRLQECHNEHDRCLSRIREVYEQFSLVVAGNPTAIKRAKAIQNLEQAFAKFKEIRANLVEGIKFYSQYTDTLQQFRDACVDFALARRMEASELARDSPLGKRI